MDLIKHEHWVTVRNRFNGQKAYGKAPIVYTLARKKWLLLHLFLNAKKH